MDEKSYHIWIDVYWGIEKIAVCIGQVYRSVLVCCKKDVVLKRIKWRYTA